MIRFVVCDDNEQIIRKTCEIINRIMMSTETDYRINRFKSYSKSMEKIIKENNDKKIYILDIELPTLSGIEIASKIREKDWKSIIIFLTVHNECKNNVFKERLMVIDYISKIKEYEQRLEEDILKSIDALGRRGILSFKYHNVTYRIPHDEILYIVSSGINKKCIITTETGRQIHLISPLKNVLKELGPEFYLSHRSCIVNVEKIKHIDFNDNTITFKNGTKDVLISVRNRKNIDEYVRNYR